QLPPARVVRVLGTGRSLEASALSAPAAISRPTWQPVRLLRLRSDEQLVALFRAGSEEAFGVIHDRYRQRLFAYTRQVLAGSRSPLHDPLAETERREDLRRLVEDVRRLPEAQRSALLMRELEGLTYEELAAALDTTVPAVKSLLVRARIGLVEAVEARETAC